MVLVCLIDSGRGLKSSISAPPDFYNRVSIRGIKYKLIIVNKIETPVLVLYREGHTRSHSEHGS